MNTKPIFRIAVKLKLRWWTHAGEPVKRRRLQTPKGQSRIIPFFQAKVTPMSRPVLDEGHIHPAIRVKVASHHQSIVNEVQAAMAAHPVVVVGMGINPAPKAARKALDAAGVAYHYLEYGNYFNTWRRRNALKMWTGWPTFPMVFVNGTLIGGASDLDNLIKSGELSALLSAQK
jgi:monothiol glutaredoxin